MRRLIAAGALFFWQCLDPTQVTLEITTDFDCVGPTKIETGASLAFDGGIDAKCKEPRRVGSLVLVPNHADRFVVQITSPAPDGRPIVARRSLSYLAHTKLRLPILLSASCAGVMCDADKTCVRGNCVPYDIDPRACKEQTCDDNTLTDAGIKMEAGASDARVDAETGIDAGMPCAENPDAATSCGNALEPYPVFSQWHFEEKLATALDPVGNNGPIALPGNFYTHTLDSSLQCGTQLFIGNNAPAVLLSSKPQFKTPPLTFSFHLRSTAQKGILLSDFDGASGWVIETVVGNAGDAGSTFYLQIKTCNNGSCDFNVAGVDVTTTWHRVIAAIDAAGRSTVTVDGFTTKPSSGAYAPPANGGLRLGYPPTALSAEIDELYFYCH